MLSPIAILVFAPVVLLGFALFALLLGSAAAGAWEAVERRLTTDSPATLRIAPREPSTARAA